MRLKLKLPVEYFDELHDKLDTNTRPRMTIDRKTLVLLMEDYENLIEACQRAGVDVDVHLSIDLLRKEAANESKLETAGHDTRTVPKVCLVCQVCKQKFPANRRDKLYCSRACQSTAHRKRKRRDADVEHV